ncbi:MAG: excinuclease ABC subunit UvrC, partial [Rhodospirillaceae bacterium]|nr:excinuclease ABC subunit UvrC [Rhodospirillaceae bacterium]
IDADVIALHQDGGRACVQVFFFRGGRNFGNRAFYPAGSAGEAPSVVLEAFLGQFYSAHTPPPEILMSHSLIESGDGVVMNDALSVRAGRKVTIKTPTRGDRARLVAHALENARGALSRKKVENETQKKLLSGLAEKLKLEQSPERIEVYDNSHVSGTKAVGAMIVAGPEGFRKNAYRKFNIKGPLAPGDDYAMMREVLTRRFSRAIKQLGDEAQDEKWDLPELVIVDGGKGQLGVAMEVFADLGIEDVALCAISKGPDRNAGREQIHQPGIAQPLILDERDPILYFLQRIRDEAHRFAIGTHRARRDKSLVRSGIDDIPGIGPGRKKALLHHFGSTGAVKDAGLNDLEAVKGISGSSARRIYDWFHTDD